MYIALFGLLVTALFAHWTRQWLRENVVLPTSYRLDEMSWKAPMPYRSTNAHQVFAASAMSSIAYTASYPILPGDVFRVDHASDIREWRP